ncbi:hypothetical protein SH528x_006419 [Novipirellula sp. SH528]|uniref:hypothetical protein n=1 Tax=Novipirellula sp. SH528 TaxID=3454466 RepID=UPI003FA14A3C
MINLATYTVQTVHGLKDTFQVSANGTVDTGQLFLTGPTSTSTKNGSAATEKNCEQKRDEKTPKQAR